VPDQPRDSLGRFVAGVFVSDQPRDHLGRFAAGQIYEHSDNIEHAVSSTRMFREEYFTQADAVARATRLVSGEHSNAYFNQTVTSVSVYLIPAGRAAPVWDRGLRRYVSATFSRDVWVVDVEGDRGLMKITL